MILSLQDDFTPFLACRAATRAISGICLVDSGAAVLLFRYPSALALDGHCWRQARFEYWLRLRRVTFAISRFCAFILVISNSALISIKRLFAPFQHAAFMNLPLMAKRVSKERDFEMML